MWGYVLKFGEIHSSSSRVMEVYSWRVWLPPNFQHPLTVKLCIRPLNFFWRCKNVLEVLYHPAKFGGVRTLHAASTAKNAEFVFVGLSVCHALERYSLRERPPRSRWNLEVVLISLARGRFAVVHPYSTLPLGGATTRRLVENVVKFGDFRISRSTKWHTSRPMLSSVYSNNLMHHSAFNA